MEITLEPLQGYCVCANTEDNARVMTLDCVLSADYKTGAPVPRPLGDILHGTERKAVEYFCLLTPERRRQPMIWIREMDLLMCLWASRIRVVMCDLCQLTCAAGDSVAKVNACAGAAHPEPW